MRRPPRRRPAWRPGPHALEARALLSATPGSHWAVGTVTFSFVPDGTDVGGVPGDLDRTLTPEDAGWRWEFRKAAAAWSEATGIPLVEVPDDGAPLGSPGATQGDPRFGDIRIAGIPRADGSLATTFAPPPSGRGTLAGDIVFDTRAEWMADHAWVGGPEPREGDPGFDIQSVALHELGHSLGLDELSHDYLDGGGAAEADAAMAPVYSGAIRKLDKDDLAAIHGNIPPSFQGGGSTSWQSALVGEGDSAGAVIDVSAAGFYRLGVEASGRIAVTRQGPDGTVAVDPAASPLMYLLPGEYRFRVQARDPGATPFRLTFEMPDYSPELILDNGAGQVTSLGLRLITPWDGLSGTAEPPSATIAPLASGLTASGTAGTPGPLANSVAPAPTSGAPPALVARMVGRPTSDVAQVGVVGPGAGTAIAYGGDLLPPLIMRVDPGAVIPPGASDGALAGMAAEPAGEAMDDAALASAGLFDRPWASLTGRATPGGTPARDPAPAAETASVASSPAGLAVVAAMALSKGLRALRRRRARSRGLAAGVGGDRGFDSKHPRPYHF